jgi:hypothetical protein
MSGPFSQITSGPPVASGVNTNKQSLIFDKASGIVEAVPDSGTTQALETAILILLAQTALSTITAAQNLFSQTLNQGVLNKSKRTIRIGGSIIFTTAGTPQITIAVKLNAVTLVSIQTPAIGNAQTNGQINFEFWITVATTGSGGTLEAHGAIGVQGGSTLAVAIPQYADQNVAVSSAVDLTSALALALTIAASSTVSSAQLRNAVVEIVN